MKIDDLYWYGYKDGKIDGFNKAIDEMVDGIREILECNAIYNIDCISTLAEQMKGGEV